MKLNIRSVGAARAKAQFLALLDEVEDKRQPVVITKNGRPVAKVVPMPLVGEDPIFGFYQGQLKIVGDVISPLYTDEDWDDFQTRSLTQMAGSELPES